MLADGLTEAAATLFEVAAEVLGSGKPGPEQVAVANGIKEMVALWRGAGPSQA